MKTVKVTLQTNFKHDGKLYRAGETVDLPEDAISGLSIDHQIALGVEGEDVKSGKSAPARPAEPKDKETHGPNAPLSNPPLAPKGKKEAP